jgi:hypothetical protein
MQIISGKDIPFILHLLKGDGTYEEQATVSYIIYDIDGTTVLVSSKATTYNTALKGYFDNLDVSADWSSMIEGNYLLVWTITGDISGFPSVIVENIAVVADGGLTAIQNDTLNNIDTTTLSTSATLNDVEVVVDNINTTTLSTSATLNDVETKIDRVLGLLHENIYIDNTEYDIYDNLISARVRLYSVSSSVGTANDILATYQITSSANEAVGKFTTWEQVKS